MQQSWSRKKGRRKKAKDAQKDSDKSPGKELLYGVLFLSTKICIFCTPYTTRHCFGSPSAKSVLICFRCFVPVVREVEGSRGSSAGEPGCWGRLPWRASDSAYWAVLAQDGWPEQARNYCDIPVRKCLSLFSNIRYTENRLCVFYWEKNHLPTHSPTLSFLIVSFGPQQMSNPMKKVVTLPWNLPLSLYPNINPEKQSKRKWLKSNAVPEHEHSRKEKCDAQSQHRSIS